MKQLLLILLFLFISCEDRLPLENDDTDPYTVVKVIEYSDTHSHYYINHYKSKPGDYIIYINEYELILPRGTYMIGDTIIITTNKYKSNAL